MDELAPHPNLRHVAHLGWPVRVHPGIGYGEAVIVGDPIDEGVSPTIVVNPVTAIMLAMPELNVWRAIDELVRRRVEILAARACRRIDAACDVDTLDV